MATILKLSKYLTSATLKSPSRCFDFQRTISTTPLLWFNQRLPRPATSRQKEIKYIEKDRVPLNYQLIYRAPMELYVAWAMHVSTLSASLISAAALYQYCTNTPLLDPVETTLVLHSEDIYYFAAGFLAINTVLRLVVSVFLLRIYKNNEKYLAVYQPQFPGGSSQYSFNQGDVKAISYVFSPWNGATYKLGNKTSLILEDYFKTPSEFQIMSIENKSDLRKEE